MTVTYRVGVDIGGTFTDIVLLGSDGTIHTKKISSSVGNYAQAIVDGLSEVFRETGLNGGAIEEAYDGYGACPLTTTYGKVLMAEFIYGGKPTPTLPLDPRKERYVNWWIKTTGLPMLYWDYMLKGREVFPTHNTGYVEPTA